jgi:hypothetical protein
MKTHLLLLILLLPFFGFSQKTETYYDFYWKPCSAENARYLGILEKTDSGWLRQDFFVQGRSLQMQAVYEDEACKTQNGFCQYYYANGNLLSAGRMIHGKQEGICISYHSNGMVSDSALFHEGRIVDKRLKWYRNGYMSDSIARINDSTEVEVGWFDDGALSHAGYRVNENPNAKWKYYYRNGQLSSLETYANGKLIAAEYFDETGKPQTDTLGINKQADFKGGIEGWKKYLSKHLYWPPNLQFTTAAEITVGVDFTLDENGKVIDAEVSLPFHPEFDKIALSIVKNSPAWIPATAHNRKVKAYRRQPITFAQSD